MKPFYRWLAVLVLGSLAACASTTRLESVDRATVSAAPYSKVLVLAISDNGQIRQVVEKGLGEELARHGVSHVVASSQMPGGLDKEDPQAIRARAEAVVRETGVDAVLVAMLLHEEVRQEYIPPREEQVPVANVPHFMGYGAYVGFHYQTVYTPGYYREEQNYYVQNTLFDASNEQQVWRAQSRTVDPVDVQQGVASLSRLVVERLLKDGMLESE